MPAFHVSHAPNLSQAPHHCHMNAAGAVKTAPMKMKKEGHGSKGSWGSPKDEILSAREMLSSGDMPPVSYPEREKSMRKLSVSSGSDASSTASNEEGGRPGKINEEEDLSEEPVSVEKASS